jgi:hypothetical protein
MHVNHRGPDVGMAEQFLYDSNIVVRLQEIVGEGMAVPSLFIIIAAVLFSASG